MKMYIAVLDWFPVYMTPTLVAHSVLGAHLKFQDNSDYQRWLNTSFKKCVVMVNEKEWNHIKQLPDVYFGHEKHTLQGMDSCAVICPRDENPNVLRFARLWKPFE